jgi:hypothetical protein
MAARNSIPNQVFIGLPWKTVRPKYERAMDWLSIRSPLSFVIVGRGDEQDAQDLLDIIKSKLENSSFALFDATGGNANVSLEYGYAEEKTFRERSIFPVIRPRARAATYPLLATLLGRGGITTPTNGVCEPFCRTFPRSIRTSSDSKRHWRLSRGGSTKARRSGSVRLC